ncbi:MAG: SCO family protein [Calditrichaeota bacterium]|nr:MAG: SCO family protein [Calditrichota bacterium]
MFQRLQIFFNSWRFPITLLFSLFFFTIFLGILLIIPPANTPFASFAEDFKVWCLRYDPATGKMQWGYVISLISQPFLLGFIVYFVWSQQLKTVFKSHLGKTLPYILGSLFLSTMLIATLGMISDRDSAIQNKGAVLPFPAEKLRTHFFAPQFLLQNQFNNPTSLEDYRGKVILITAIYAECGSTCPRIISQIRETLSQLSEAERNELRILGITLNPEHDSPNVLRALAKAHQLPTPEVQLLTGDPLYVNQILDKFGFSRSRDPETGLITHANLFILIDRSGQIAFRFTLGERQQKWLLSAIRLLIHETLKPQTKA